MLIRSKSVQLPANTSKLDKNTFVNKDNVVVDVYIDSETLGAFVADETTSKYHRIIKKAIPEEQAPWGVEGLHIMMRPEQPLLVLVIPVK